ncbi:hypothetical protein QR680_004204 [Steinernema hermaphroditum]|uniref:Secreted protein n=1 Tax=Steinernema hermaphroditum TaxID=289476 RepID=A0AA39HNZ9_9BILA|nr:hypothetical protein QR680_004204 [Steinernema hermaphroditum]
MNTALELLLELLLVVGALETSSSERLDSGVLVPEAGGSVPAEVDFHLKGRLHVLHVVVEHGDGDYGRQRGNGRDRNAEECEFSEAFRLVKLGFVV